MNKPQKSRRRFIKHCAMGLGSVALGAYTLHDFIKNEVEGELRVGFRNDAPGSLWRWSREALWYEKKSGMVLCKLCPHLCILNNNDRGFCRTRVVKDNKLYTVAYGNPCSVNIDPIEKKPMFHFLPGTPIMSVATAGCNLRCKNCQNASISQEKPENTTNSDIMPDTLVNFTKEKKIPSIAYTYSDPIVFYEYTKDTSQLARSRGIKNVLVTAGYIEEKPLREICRVTDGVNIDLKAFNDNTYKKLVGGKLNPVLKAHEVLKEEGVWFEITRLIVPGWSDDMQDIKEMCRWIVKTLGPDVPLHISRCHPAFKLKNIPPTPVEVLANASDVAREAGLHFVYVGNIPGKENQQTVCHACKEVVIDRQGYRIIFNRLINGHCPCGNKIPGVWS